MTDLISRKPQVGMFASLAGLVTSVAACTQTLSIILGLLGAVFGLLAGYYTFRIQKSKWDDRVLKHKIHPKDQSK